MLSPFLVDGPLAVKPWGARNLERFGKTLPEGALVGESWEIADFAPGSTTTVPDPRCRVRTGEHTGKSLRELIDRYGSDFLGSASPGEDGYFPLLVKYLDAGEHLSVQVHPNSDYVSAHPGTRLKTESWYVVDAAPGSVIFLGFEEGVTYDDLAQAIGTSDLPSLLKHVPANAGDFHHVPAGTVHALGAGVMVAEIQTPSDTTFRMYDWIAEYGRTPRPLHLAEALETIQLDSEGITTPARSESSSRRLIENQHYWVTEHCLSGDIPLAAESELRILMVLTGAVRVNGVVARRGDTMVVPASVAGGMTGSVDPEGLVLEVGLVPPGRSQARS